MSEVGIDAVVDLMGSNLTPTLRTRQGYEQWRENTLRPLYPKEYAWWEQFGSGGKNCIYDLIDDLLPEEFRLEQRREWRSNVWSNTAAFLIEVMKIIRDHHLWDTHLILQRSKKTGDNLVLVRTVMGEIAGKGTITAGIAGASGSSYTTENV